VGMSPPFERRKVIPFWGLLSLGPGQPGLTFSRIIPSCRWNRSRSAAMFTRVSIMLAPGNFGYKRHDDGGNATRKVTAKPREAAHVRVLPDRDRNADLAEGLNRATSPT
jgi:hypothetical protein